MNATGQRGGSATLDAVALAQGGDQEAMARLIEENSPLIWSVVRRFFGRGAEPDDLYQLGCIGFIKAVQGFSWDYGTQFSTYAVPKIAGEVKRFLRVDGMVKVSRTLKENAAKVWAARDAYEKRHGVEARLSDISELTGLSPEDIAACLQANVDTASLDAAMGDSDGDGFSLLSTLSSGDEDKLVEHIALRTAMDTLDETQRQVLVLRYFRDMTQQKAAQILGLSQVQVSRLEKKAVAQIREILLE